MSIKGEKVNLIKTSSMNSVSSDNLMNIKVKTLDNSLHEFTVTKDTSIVDLKNKIAAVMPDLSLFVIFVENQRASEPTKDNFPRKNAKKY